MKNPDGIEIKVGQIWRDLTRTASLRKIIRIEASYVVTEHPQRLGLATKVAIRKLKAPSWALEGDAE